MGVAKRFRYFGKNIWSSYVEQTKYIPFIFVLYLGIIDWKTIFPNNSNRLKLHSKNRLILTHRASENSSVNSFTTVWTSFPAWDVPSFFSVEKPPNLISQVQSYGRKTIITKGRRKQKTTPHPQKKKNQAKRCIYQNHILGKESMLKIVHDSIYSLCSPSCRYGDTLLVTEHNFFFSQDSHYFKES